MSPDPDRACPHVDFVASVEVNRLLDADGVVEGYSADVRIRCAAEVCEEPFRFIGVRAGLDPRGPACSVDETEAHLPIRPSGSDPDFGMGLPGFSIRME